MQNRDKAVKFGGVRYRSVLRPATTCVPLDKSIFLSVTLTKILCGFSVSETGLSEAMYWFQLVYRECNWETKKSYAVQNFQFKCNDEASLLQKT